jgi:hypothetical protein
LYKKYKKFIVLKVLIYLINILKLSFVRWFQEWE